MRNHMFLYVFFPNIKASVYIGYIGIHIWCIFTLKKTWMDLNMKLPE